MSGDTGIPGVSVVIPCRNGEATLAQAIRSALAQTEPPLEVVVIDDGSSDATAAIARGFTPDVTLHDGPARGAAAARAMGAGLVRGRRLMFLDADDLLTPGTLAALGAALDAAPEPSVALCPWDRMERVGDAWLVRPPSAAPRRPGQDDLAAWLTGSWSPPCAVLWDRAALDRAGGWDQDPGSDDDGRLMRRAMARGVPVRRTRAGLALYRRAPDGDSLSGRRFTAAMLRSRVVSLTDTRDELARAGRLDAYRRPLAEAAEELRRDAEACPETAEEIAAACRGIAQGRPGPRAGAGRRAAWLRDGLGARFRSPPDPEARGRRESAADGGRDRPGRANAGVGGAPPEPLDAHGAAAGRRSGAVEAPPDGAPLVSVVIPTFNRPEATERAARSVLAQTHRALELLVVDDGSTDGTGERVARLGDPRLRVVRQPNGGVARARNRGLGEARGAYIAFLDSDDEWRPDKLARQVAAMEAAPARVGFCSTGAEIRSAAGVEIRRGGPRGDAFAALLVTNLVHAPTSCGLIRREVFEAVGGFDPDLPAIEDWEWLQRVARLFDLEAVDDPLTLYADAGPRRPAPIA